MSIFTTLIGLLISSLLQASPQPAATAKVEDLSWLSGDWQTTMGRSQTDEHWTGVAGGSLMGLSRTVSGNRTASFEYLRIETRPDGIYYVAHPGARSPGVGFKLVRLE